MKLVSIVGARPQFIKCAPLSRELREEHSEYRRGRRREDSTMLKMINSPAHRYVNKATDSAQVINSKRTQMTPIFNGDI